MKNIIIGVLVVILIVLGGYIVIQNTNTTMVDNDLKDRGGRLPMPVEPDGGIGDGAEPLPGDAEFEDEGLVGTSVEGNDIEAFRYGTGDTEILFVGGIHGGYSWNTVSVAYELMDYLDSNPEVVPENVMVTVIPVLNPDGLEQVVGTTGRFANADVPESETARIPGRFNGNNVDLNRNFDCAWRPEGTWRSTTVDAGNAPFSEPESKAFRNYVLNNRPAAVVAFYSAAGGVFASNCGDGVLSETSRITNVYADASGYPAFEEFDYYEVTGDMVNWLAKESVPAISVLLSTHESTELSKNLRGVEALLDFYKN